MQDLERVRAAAELYVEFYGKVKQLELELQELKSKLVGLYESLDSTHRAAVKAFEDEFDADAVHSVRVSAARAVVVYVPADEERARLLVTTPS